MKIGHPWSRPNPPGAPTAAGYLSITNTGKTPDRLLGGASPAATTIEVHEMSMAGGIMRMRPVVVGLVIALGETVKLEPGGYHLMIIGPKRAFKVGDHIPVTLNFEKVGQIKVDFDVEATAPASAPPMSGGGRHTRHVRDEPLMPRARVTVLAADGQPLVRRRRHGAARPLRPAAGRERRTGCLARRTIRLDRPVRAAGDRPGPSREASADVLWLH